jgi:hypothetical protein
MAGAILKPAGDLTAGVQVKGAVKQYQYDGVNDATAALETITPGDGSSTGAAGATIIGTVPPGKAGIRQVSTVVQRASVLLADSTAGNVGNALVSDYSVVAGHGDPTPPTGSTAADGLSQAPEHE